MPRWLWSDGKAGLQPRRSFLPPPFIFIVLKEVWKLKGKLYEFCGPSAGLPELLCSWDSFPACAFWDQTVVFHCLVGSHWNFFLVFWILLKALRCRCSRSTVMVVFSSWCDRMQGVVRVLCSILQLVFEGYSKLSVIKGKCLMDQIFDWELKSADVRNTFNMINNHIK